VWCVSEVILAQQGNEWLCESAATGGVGHQLGVRVIEAVCIFGGPKRCTKQAMPSQKAMRATPSWVLGSFCLAVVVVVGNAYHAI